MVRPWPAAIAGATASTETASSAAEMVFSMVVSSWDPGLAVGWPDPSIMQVKLAAPR